MAIKKKDLKNPENKTAQRVGRPSKYRPEYCEMLIDHMNTGLSFESFAAIIGTNRDTLYEWAKVYPEFSDAKKRAIDLCLLFWERLGMAGITGKIEGFAIGGWIFSMKARFRWSEVAAESEGSEEKEFVKALSDAISEMEKAKAGKNKKAKS